MSGLPGSGGGGGWDDGHRCPGRESSLYQTARLRPSQRAAPVLARAADAPRRYSREPPTRSQDSPTPKTRRDVMTIGPENYGNGEALTDDRFAAQLSGYRPAARRDSSAVLP